MEALFIGLALSFNILIIIWKLKHRSKTDAFMDALLLGTVMYISGGTIMGTMIGTVASFVVSTYLLVYPFEPIKTPKIRLPKLPRLNIWNTIKSLLRLPTISIKWSN